MLVLVVTDCTGKQIGPTVKVDQLLLLSALDAYRKSLPTGWTATAHWQKAEISI